MKKIIILLILTVFFSGCMFRVKKGKANFAGIRTISAEKFHSDKAENNYTLIINEKNNHLYFFIKGEKVYNERKKLKYYQKYNREKKLKLTTLGAWSIIPATPVFLLSPLVLIQWPIFGAMATDESWEKGPYSKIEDTGKTKTEKIPFINGQLVIADENGKENKIPIKNGKASISLNSISILLGEYVIKFQSNNETRVSFNKTIPFSNKTLIKIAKTHLKNKKFLQAAKYFYKAKKPKLAQRAIRKKALQILGNKLNKGKFGGGYNKLKWGMNPIEVYSSLKSNGFSTKENKTPDLIEIMQNQLHEMKKGFNPSALAREKEISLHKDNLEIICYFYEIVPKYFALYQVALNFDESKMSINDEIYMTAKASRKYINRNFKKKLEQKYGQAEAGKPLQVSKYWPKLDGWHFFELTNYFWDDKYTSIQITVSKMKEGKLHFSGKLDPAIYYTSNIIWNYRKKIKKAANATKNTDAL